MRTIKFRAKSCYMGGTQPAWVYGTFQYISQRRVRPGATDNGTLEPRSDKGRIVDLYGTETEVLCDTVGQFTGMTDKNGKEIYEGDIIRFVNGQKKVSGEWVDNEFIYTIEYSEGAFCGVLGLSKALCAVEVIGNIHDNPELIKRH